ncbi:MAG: GIY-YIG nuclease family protein [Candidatus Omnitrophica bacterium]|nr:GIY-YIG nuclease family protein [Candidatus Omnitrophota bacterium]MBU1869004.1 GIY-YIG nuclease family protein [Candidatus Omnitrophota bacterium]
MLWHVYIIECSDGKLYTGITSDLKRRIKEHNSGNGCRFTRCRTPVTLVYKEDLPTRSEALKREARIKHLARTKKCKLIAE